VTGAFDVVIVAYESREVIGTCVAAARSLPDVGAVVVVDHGDDGSGAIAASAGALVVPNPANPGFGAGQNRGVAATTAPVLLLCNPDAVVAPEGIVAGLALLSAEPEVGAVQGAITNRATGAPERSGGRELGPVHLVGRALGARRLLQWRPVRALARRVAPVADHVIRVPDAPVVVETLAATALLVRRAAFDEVGGFDEAYFLYGEDLDLCRRLRARGWRLVALPEPFAVHESGASAASATARELTWWRGTMQFAARWWSPEAWAWAVASAGVRWCRLAVRSPVGARRAWREMVADPLRERRACRAVTSP
jgi:GT2 family glycosyltransferase